MPVPPPEPQGGGGGGGPPSGAAGGDLAGTYPNPTVGLLKITDGKVAVANKDGLANVPSLRTLGTGAQQALAGNTAVGGITAAQANTALSAGGSNPITELGLVTVVDGVGSVSVTDDPGQVGSPVLTVDGVGASSDRIVLRALGPYIEMYDNTPVILGLYQSSSLVFGADITPGDAFTNVATLLFNDDGDGHMVLSNSADGKQRIDLNAATGMLSLGADITGASATVIVSDDGQGAKFLDSNGSTLTQLAGDGVTGLIIADTFTTNRVAIAPDGTGISLNDGVFTRVLIPDDTSLGIQLNNAAGELSAQLADGALFVYEDDASASLTPHALAFADDGVTVDQAVGLSSVHAGPMLRFNVYDDDAGMAISQLYINDNANNAQFVFAWQSVGAGGSMSGVFGATPYGQDAYLAPLDDNLSALTTLVDLITAENETRTRINAINGYLIARGWEAAA